MAECPTCDRDDFKSEHGVKLHHARTHGESLVKSTRECAYCGSPVTVYDSHRGKNERVFCSDSDCYPNWQSENRSGETCSWLGDGSKITVECVICREEKELYPSRVENHDVFFCSSECNGEWLAEGWRGEKNPQWSGGESTVECEICGDEFEVRAIREDTAVTCSRDCRGEWMSLNNRGEGHWNWKGGREEYGAGWTKEKRARVRHRDNHTCQHPGCSITNDDHAEVYDVSLHVHHIQNRRQFDNDEEKNAMENLVSLCIPHHRLWEQLSPLTPSNYAR